MHEMSLAEGVLQIVEDAARSQGFSQVTAVRLEIGRLSSVEPEALRFCFDVVVRGSLAEGAAGGASGDRGYPRHGLVPAVQ